MKIARAQYVITAALIGALAGTSAVGQEGDQEAFLSPEIVSSTMTLRRRALIVIPQNV